MATFAISTVAISGMSRDLIASRLLIPGTQQFRLDQVLHFCNRYPPSLSGTDFPPIHRKPSILVAGNDDHKHTPVSRQSIREKWHP